MMDSVILFDGHCGLCNGWVDFLLVRDRHRRFRFASLQSDPAKALLREFGAAAFAETVVLIQGDGIYTRSTAALRAFRTLGFPWRLLGVLLLVPQPLRDAVYDFVARHRYHWFGRSDVCRVPTGDEEERFLQG